jgi:hypothetical protein
MEINVGDEKIVELVSTYSTEVIQDRVMSRKMDAFGQLAKFMQRPRPEEIVIAQSEKRYEPFWYGSAQAHYSYDRRHRYQVDVAPEVQSVTLYDKDYEIAHDPGAERRRHFTLDAVEHCIESSKRELMLDPVRGEPRDYARYLSFQHREVPDLDTLQEGGAVVVPPEVRSSFLVRKLVQMLMKTLQADKIHEERIDLDQVILFYRPVYAFELYWKSKEKRSVLEFDALTADIRAEGGQLKKGLVKVLENDALFDIGSDAIGTIMPGANIAVKLGRIAARKAIG